LKYDKLKNNWNNGPDKSTSWEKWESSGRLTAEREREAEKLIIKDKDVNWQHR
jgi:hypothetical protein